MKEEDLTIKWFPEDSPTLKVRYMKILHRKYRCKDYDQDCLSIENYEHCHAYDPKSGICPFLNRKS